MNKHREVLRFGENSGPAEKSTWGLSIALGVLIAAASFTLVLSAVAWFMPKFLGFTQSRWARLLPAISILFISTSGLLQYRRKHHTSIRKAR